MLPIHSFAPISCATATILILGSIPGIASLTAQQYYAHPRNAFWPIMANIYQFDASICYEARVKALKAANVALWDVLQQCVRPGSLDSAIQKDSRVANDFEIFLKTHPHIRLIAFNGAEAEKSFKKHVLTLQNLPTIRLLRLPSTSPAHTIPFDKKMAAWREISI